jgi:hypothetical protein
MSKAGAGTSAPAPSWTFESSANTYIVPDEGNYVQPTITADRGWLHLAARVNYETLNIASIWFGYNFPVERGCPGS